MKPPLEFRAKKTVPVTRKKATTTRPRDTNKATEAVAKGPRPFKCPVCADTGLVGPSGAETPCAACAKGKRLAMKRTNDPVTGQIRKKGWQDPEPIPDTVPLNKTERRRLAELEVKLAIRRRRDTVRKRRWRRNKAKEEA